MRPILVALLLVAACSTDPESNYPDASGLYRIEGKYLYCDGGSVWATQPDAPPFLVVTCAWECLTVDGRDVTRVDLTFRRDSVDSPWRHTFSGWNFGVCDCSHSVEGC